MNRIKTLLPVTVHPPANPSTEVRKLRVQVETLHSICNEHIYQIHWLERQLVESRIKCLSVQIEHAELTGDAMTVMRLTESLEGELQVLGHLR